MNLCAAAVVLEDLRQQGVELDFVRGSIIARGPTRALTAEAYQKLAYYREELAELLWSEPEQSAAATAWQPPLRHADSPFDNAGRPVPVVDARPQEAAFASGMRAQLRPTANGRWELWLRCGDRWQRRKNFAASSSAEASRAIEAWFGPPTAAWATSQREEP